MKKERAGILDVLGLVFTTLKLLNIINWSWFWVLSPFLLEIIIIYLVKKIEEIEEQKYIDFNVYLIELLQQQNNLIYLIAILFSIGILIFLL